MPPEIDLRDVRRGSVMAPAGCGKTQLIADTLGQHAASKPVLVLTHTNAGVAALRKRLRALGVPQAAFQVGTIDGFAMQLVARFPTRSGIDPQHLKLIQPRTDYPALREGARRILQERHLHSSLCATYAGVIVDEYQDCNAVQHAIIAWLAEDLPTCVFGDPMQAIFGFRGNTLVDWTADVLPYFPAVGQLETPWRWVNAGTGDFGRWLLAARETLAGGGAIDLRVAPPEVQWIRLDAATADQQRIQAARTAAPLPHGTVLVIGDSINATGRRQMASQTPGATLVEKADLEDLTEFARTFTVDAADAAQRLIVFLADIMTNVGAAELVRRLDSLLRGTARNPPTTAETALLALIRGPGYATALQAVIAVREQPNVRVYRPEVLNAFTNALRVAQQGAQTFYEAALAERERGRHLGRLVTQRAVGSTLLLKGLEADVGVILYPERMDAKHLYVALTRGARRVVVCSHHPLIGA